MNDASGLNLLARYNAWINKQIYDASERLSDGERNADQGAFFGSISGTLNHIVVGDSIWLRRFAMAECSANQQMGDELLDWLPEPGRLDDCLFADWQSLRSMRERIDRFVIDWVGHLGAEELAKPLAYQNTRGRPFRRELGSLLLHFFNHQTHHRGQVSTLLFQNGIDPGITDMLEVIFEAD